MIRRHVNNYSISDHVIWVLYTIHQAVIHPAYLIYMQSISCKMSGLDEVQAGIKISRRNINNLRYTDDTNLIAESEGELEPLDKSERGE